MNVVLVTGGCGFIGSHFIRTLFARNSFTGRVINVDKLTYAANLENVADVAAAHPDRYRFVQADIANRKVMASLFETEQIDTVVHFAAESHVDRSIAGSEPFMTSNIMGTWSLLEAARSIWGDHPDPEHFRFHHVSTDEVFGHLGLEDPPFTEETPYAPRSPYSASKAASDHLVRAWHHTYGLPVTISNCSNNYGPCQYPEKLIPVVILNAVNGKPIPVYGDGRNVRDWLFVVDHCEGILRVLEKGRPGETYNFGGGCELANIDLVHMICDILDALFPMDGQQSASDSVSARKNEDEGCLSSTAHAHSTRPLSSFSSPITHHPLRITSYTELITFVPDRPGHDRRYAMDIRKVEEKLGWKPTTPLKDGLSQTVKWYLARHAL